MIGRASQLVGPVINKPVYSWVNWAIHEKHLCRDWVGTYTSQREFVSERNSIQHTSSEYVIQGLYQAGLHSYSSLSFPIACQTLNIWSWFPPIHRLFTVSLPHVYCAGIYVVIAYTLLTVLLLYVFYTGWVQNVIKTHLKISNEFTEGPTRAGI